MRSLECAGGGGGGGLDLDNGPGKWKGGGVGRLSEGVGEVGNEGEVREVEVKCCAIHTTVPRRKQEGCHSSAARRLDSVTLASGQLHVKVAWGARTRIVESSAPESRLSEGVAWALARDDCEFLRCIVGRKADPFFQPKHNPPSLRWDAKIAVSCCSQ